MAKLSNSELQEKLIKFIEDITIGQETVRPDTHLYDLGLDSLDYTDLCYELSNWGYAQPVICPCNPPPSEQRNGPSPPKTSSSIL